MNKKKYIINEKGSITLFVLVSMLFFLVTVVSVATFLKNKERALEIEYQQIKQSYEQNIENNN